MQKVKKHHSKKSKIKYHYLFVVALFFFLSIYVGTKPVEAISFNFNFFNPLNSSSYQSYLERNCSILGVVMGCGGGIYNPPTVTKPAVNLWFN
ncbi:MAG: hypothetical protein WCT07_02925 [Candidatus Paceibacterota bacterium]